MTQRDVKTSLPKPRIDNSAALDLLTIDEVAAMLKTSRKAIFHRIARGQIPAVRLGRSVFVRRGDLAGSLIGYPEVPKKSPTSVAARGTRRFAPIGSTHDPDKQLIMENRIATFVFDAPAEQVPIEAAYDFARALERRYRGLIARLVGVHRGSYVLDILIVGPDGQMASIEADVRDGKIPKLSFGEGIRAMHFQWRAVSGGGRWLGGDHGPHLPPIGPGRKSPLDHDVPAELRGVTVKAARDNEGLLRLLEMYTGKDLAIIKGRLASERGNKRLSNIFQFVGIDETVVILTALDIEFEAVRAFLLRPVEELRSRGGIYEVGIYPKEAPVFRVVLREIGAGNAGAAVEVERAIEHHRPKYVFFVGVAGGLKDVEVGDVVCASRVYCYESGKETKEGFQPRPVSFVPSAALIDRARAVKRAHNRGDYGCVDFKIFDGPIAAGDKVIAASSSRTAALLRAMYGDALAVAMEEAGFLEGAYGNHTEAMVVRGISDLLDGKAASEAAGSQRRASRNAALVAFRMLDGLGKASV